MAFRILSISYDPHLLWTRQQILETRGYSVKSAVGFTEALESCRAEGFDLVVLGHSIPHADKQALLAAVKETCKAPVIALARAMEPKLDGVAHTVDPISPADFLRAVDNILRPI